MVPELSEGFLGYRPGIGQKPRGPARGAPRAGPGVGPHVVVVVPGGEEEGPGVVLLGNGEAQGPGVERFGFPQIRHVEVDVPEPGLGRERSPAWGLPEEGLEVEGAVNMRTPGRSLGRGQVALGLSR